MSTFASKHPAVLLGVRDWIHPEWYGRFYPSDLPQDWALTYFNTQFSCVWLPHARWSQAEHDEISRWAEDTHGDFYFILEHGNASEESITAVTERLGPRIACICEEKSPNLTWFGANPDLKALSKAVQQSGDDSPCILLSSDGDLQAIDQIRTLLDLLGK